MIVTVRFLEQICSYFKIVNVEFLLTHELGILLCALCFMYSIQPILFEALLLIGPCFKHLEFNSAQILGREEDYNK